MEGFAQLSSGLQHSITRQGKGFGLERVFLHARLRKRLQTQVPQISQLFSRLGHSATAWEMEPQPRRGTTSADPGIWQLLLVAVVFSVGV